MCEPLDVTGLDKETADRLEIKEDSEPTFDRVIDYDYTDQMFQTIESRRSKLSQHSYLTSFYGAQGMGKSYSALALSGLLDENFSVDNVFFSYDDLVYKRKQLKEHSAVLVDEQSASFGLDSNRVMIVLNALKEQLRKKSIHMAFCSPTLHAEYQSSMYVFETLFIDYKKQEVVCAYKTRDLHCLGHVHIPSPVNILGQKFIDAYEAKKDAHLDKLTGQTQIDDIEERAKLISTHRLFKTAELVYLKKRGFIPMNMLMQIVGKISPEYKQSIIASEIASRIKLNRELEGKWRVGGR